jgi:hypothetical protein
MGVDVVNAELQRFIERRDWFGSQHTEFIVAAQPMALFPLITVLTGWV